MSKHPRLALLASADRPRPGSGRGAAREPRFVPLEQADAAVVLGGDGFMLQSLHQMLDNDRVIPAYGLNLGTVGFLMNRQRSSRSLAERIARARAVAVCPLAMTATTGSGSEETLRDQRSLAAARNPPDRQAGSTVNGKVRMAELAGDGVLVATPAGSTAYNLSANGPILPLGSAMLALTPISPFRPRRWRGAILPDTTRSSSACSSRKSARLPPWPTRRKCATLPKWPRGARTAADPAVRSRAKAWKSGSLPNSSSTDFATIARFAALAKPDCTAIGPPLPGRPGCSPIAQR